MFDFHKKHDNILRYSKSNTCIFNQQYEEYEPGTINRFNMIEEETGKRYKITFRDGKEYKTYMGEGKPMEDVWVIPIVMKNALQNTNYPTQKPETLLERIIKVSTNPGDLVFDCFMGSGTTQAVAMKLGRRFIGADINLGAIHTTTKRLLSIVKDLGGEEKKDKKGPALEYSISEDTLASEAADSESIEGKKKERFYTGFQVYNVNNYDFFRNPLEARDLLIEALGIQPFPQSNIWDGELDGRMVKVMPVNRIASKADLESLSANLPYKMYEKRKEENPNQVVEKITLVCMGHEPDLKASFEQNLKEYKLDIEVVDILRDKTDLQFKREAEAEILKKGENLIIRSFYPLNLMQKLSLQKEYIEDWRELVESIVIDWNFDGAVMHPTMLDIPEKKEIVKGVYPIPKNVGTIKVKITDVLSETLEVEVPL